MKPQFFKRGSLGVMLAIVPLVGGCNQQTGQSPESLVTVAFAEPAVQAAAEGNAPAPAAPDAPATPAGKAEAVPAALEEKPLPSTVKASGPLAEVIKLAQAGVDEEVMVTYITNSTSTFSLTSDEIIYLNDIGVANNVVTTIIEHDQAMKQYWANAAQAQAAASTPAPALDNQTDQTAAAPSDVNPPQAAEPQPEIANNNYFYDTLSPYGSWVNVDGYGLCWQPTVSVINRGWQPYGDRGHWVYTDCGWYWMSDYSWGATTFHYGRWFSHPRWGWCWWPDRVWGPSWVTWRSGGDYCGWAPLPPFAYYRPGFGFSFRGRSVGFSFDFGIGASCYTFVPFSRFCDPHPYRHRFQSHQVTQVFNKTTIINNFGAGSRNTVINHGIAPDRITAVTRQEIRKVSIRDAGPALAKEPRHERLEKDGRTLTVHRANIPENPTDRTSARTVTSGKSSPYAPLQTSRSENKKEDIKRDDMRPGTARSSFEENRTSTHTTASRGPEEDHTATPTSPTTVGSRPSLAPRSIPTPSAKPDSRSDRSPKVDDNPRGKSRGPGNGATVSPSIVRDSGVASPSSPTAPLTPRDTTPNSSLVVIGKRDAAQPRRLGPSATPAPQTRVAELEPRDMQVRTRTPAPDAPASSARPTAPKSQFSQPPQPQPSAPASTYSRSPGASSQSIARQEVPRATRSTEDRSFSRPSYSAPAPVQRQTVPSYSPPPSAPAPTPRYDRSPPSSYQQSAPRSAPAPGYSPPASSPAPVQRAQPNPPSRSESGGGPKGRNQ